MRGVKSFVIWAITLAASAIAITHTDGVWWAITIAWVTVAGGAWCQRAADRAGRVRA